jgi:hypothetical protein
LFVELWAKDFTPPSSNSITMLKKCIFILSLRYC